MRRKPAVIPEDVSRQLEVICDACKAHGPGEIHIRCPFCGADDAFGICNTEASAGGYCSVCKKSAHIKWDRRHLPWVKEPAAPNPE